MKWLQPEILYRAIFLSEPILAPDGKRLAYLRTRIEPREKKSYVSDLWLYDLPNRRHQRLTFHTRARVSYPRWQPLQKDGRSHYLAFLSERGEPKQGAQLWLLPTEGGEAQKRTDLEGGVRRPKWSPTGQKIFFLGTPKTKERTKTEGVTEIHRIFYKLNGAGWIEQRNDQVFSIALDHKKPKLLTDLEVPVEDYTVSLDEKYLYLVTRLGEEYGRVPQRSLYRFNLQRKEITEILAFSGPIWNLSLSPDGTFLVFYGNPLTHGFGTRSQVYRLDLSTGQLRSLTAHFDRSVGNALNSDFRVPSSLQGPTWGPDDWIYFLATDGPVCSLFRVDPDGHTIERITPPKGSVEGFSLAQADPTLLAFAWMSFTQPTELYLRRGDKTRQITRVGKRIFRRWQFQKPRKLNVTASDGQELQVFYLPPYPQKDSKEAHPAPAVLEIHGGPRTTYGDALMLEFHLLAAAGLGVIFTNPRGSEGFGEEFSTAVSKHYGERDFQDLMEAVDAVVHQGWVDPDRLGVTGGSYGGFMTNWIIGHTHRFKAAVTQRSISNFVSFFGTADIGYRFAEFEIGETPWENLEEYWKRSPLAYVKAIQTPLLIIHAEQDLRCPIEQAEQLFVALKYLGREVVFVRYADENHDLSRSGKPHHRVDRLQRIIAWMKKYLLDSPTKSG